MGRQLFLHHYLPAHLASALVAGAIVEFIFNIEPADIANKQIKDGANASKEAAASARRPVRERLAGQSLMVTWAASGVIIATLLWGFWFFAPLTYGKPGLNIEEVNRRKWLNYDLHFAK